MMDKITIRLPEDVRETVERNAESNGMSMSEYIRNLVESDDGTTTRELLPKGLREVVEKDLEDGIFFDECECILHYIREGMRKEGRLQRIPAANPKGLPTRHGSHEDYHGLFLEGVRE